MSETAVVKGSRSRATGGVRRTVYLIKRIETFVRVLMDADLRDFGITSGQYTLLSLVSREGGLSSAELARRTSVTPQSMNESITALEQKGVIRRTEDRDNRRILQIALTREGRRVLALCDKAVDRIEANVFASLTGTSLEQFRAALEVIVESETDRS